MIVLTLRGVQNRALSRSEVLALCKQGVHGLCRAYEILRLWYYGMVISYKV